MCVCVSSSSSCLGPLKQFLLTYLYFIFIYVHSLQSNFYRSVHNYDFTADSIPFFQQGIDSFCKMCITSALAHRQHWKTLQHGIAFSISSFVRHLKSKLSQPLLQPPSLAQQTLFSLAAGMLTIRGGQIKLPNESRLVSIYVSSAGNTNSLKRCQSLQVGICLCKYCLSEAQNMSFAIKKETQLQIGSVKSCYWWDKNVFNVSQLFWITLYAAVLQVHDVVLYELNAHTPQFFLSFHLSVELWGSRLFSCQTHKTHVYLVKTEHWPTSRSNFLENVNTHGFELWKLSANDTLVFFQLIM